MDETTKKAVIKILRVFKSKELGEGGFVHFDEFAKAKAIIWDRGHVKHDNQKDALMYLRHNGYVNESEAGLELTEKGAKALKSV
jgi:hypothetical protein